MNYKVEEIKSWIESEKKDYEKGTGLFAAASPNKILARRFVLGTAMYQMDSLIYEMKKLYALLVEKEGLPEVVKNVALQAEEKRADDEGRYPKVIAEAKRKIEALWIELSRYQRELLETGEGNEPEKQEARVRIMAQRDPVMDRYNELYELKEEYFVTGVVPERLETLLKELNGEETKKVVEGIYSDLGDVELVKRRKATKMGITRRQNQLRYQSNTAAAEPSPMPDGPKRKKIESDMKQLQIEIRELDKEIKRRGI